jgi:hypothetical protein
MAVSANVLRVSTTLRLGERVLVRCDDGLLATEYALFDASDIVLRATDPVSVRETGYITTARDALGRLARAGVTPELADEAARAISPEVVTSFGRSGALGSIAPELGAQELFDGAVYRAASQTYEGAWLDLRSLASAIQHPGASSGLQALHLVAALNEVSRTTPLHLSTANATRDRRPGERTHRRVALEGVVDFPQVLRRLAPKVRGGEIDAQRDRLVRDALLARVRERASADAGLKLRAHLSRLEGALALVETRSTGPLADPELWAIEQQLASGDAQGVRERLDELERARGGSAAIRYLRARAALVGGDEPPSSVAQTLSVIANEERTFHEAELVAARAWLAAGEDAYARHFARRLAENPTARDSERLIALEILDATSATTPSQAPPAVAPRAVAPLAGVPPAGVPPAGAPPAGVPPAGVPPAGAPPTGAPREMAAAPPGPAASLAAPEAREAREEPAPRPTSPPLIVPPVREEPAPVVVLPALREMPTPREVPQAREPASPPAYVQAEREVAHEVLPPDVPRYVARAPVVESAPSLYRTIGAAPAPQPQPYVSSPPGASLPPAATVPPPRPPDGARPAERTEVGRTHYEPELVESLALPLGATEEVLAIGDWPTTPLQARTAMTRLARSLARDYRLWYGTTLRCNVLAVDAMQRHLAQRYAGATLADAKVVAELQRHGALLSEIFSRSLGADWVDIGPTEPGYWAMFVPPKTRCWPMGRVYRFVSLGRRERDLVSYYLDIEARARNL